MESTIEIERDLKAYVAREFLEGDDATLDVETPLLTLGVIDSLNMVSLLSYLEGKYGVLVAGELVTPRNFESIRSIAALARSLVDARVGEPPTARKDGATQILEQAYNLLVSEGVDRRYAATKAGSRVHYLAVDGAAPTWVFLPGMGTPSSSWGPILHMIRGERRAIAPDYLGFGLSGDDRAAPTHKDQIAAVLDVLEASVDGPMILIGNSAGALVATELARRMADRVQALVIVGFGLLEDPRAWWNRLRALSASPGDFLQAAYFRPPRLTPNLDAALRAILQRPAYHSFLDDEGVAAMKKTFAGIRVPTLFVSGERDGFFPVDTVSAAARSVPGAHHEILARCGHFPPIEQPNELLYVIDAFLGRAREARA